MRFFHLSDLHIGASLFRYSLVEEQRFVLDQVISAAKTRRPDALVIAGDVYDKSVPSAEAVALLDDFLTELSKEMPQMRILMIGGNHDSAQRLSFGSRILKERGICIAAIPPQAPEEFLQKVSFSDAYGIVDFYLLPFIKPGYAARLGLPADGYEAAVRSFIEREEINKDHRNVLVSHQFYISSGSEPKRSDSEVISVGNIDAVNAAVLEPFDYAALGHLHRAQTVGERYIYPGTVYPYSLSEADAAHEILETELLQKGEAPVLTRIPLTPNRQVHRFSGELSKLLEKADDWKEDFVAVTLTDENYPSDIRGLLLSYFPYLLHLDFDNAHTRRILSELPEMTDSLDPYEVFASFFSEQNGREMDDAEKARLADTINAIGGFA